MEKVHRLNRRGDTQNTSAEGGKDWGGARPGAGRKPKAEKQAGKTVSAYLVQNELDYLAKWGDSPTAALRALLDRAEKFWPNGI